MNEVETALMLDGISHHFVIGVELFGERINHRLDMFRLYIRNNIYIQRRAHDAMQGTGQGATYRIRNAKMFKGLCNKQCNAGDFTLHARKPFEPVLLQA